ncbi:MAG: hypothetical protein HY562_01850, partial [Ignavibacteriales bacterium]|nr:hypothetical protein [Ignavibacteriales bacterium]
RILDGIGDYVSAIAFFAAIGYWGVANSYEPLLWWPVTLTTLLVYGWQSALVDFYRNEFVARMAGARSFLEREMKETREELVDLKYRRGKMIEKFALAMYLYYLTMQSKIQAREQSPIHSHTYVTANSNIIRFWCLNGSATSRFLIVVACVMNHVEFFVGYVLVFGTLWSLSLQAFQMAIDKKLEEKESP